MVQLAASATHLLTNSPTSVPMSSAKTYVAILKGCVTSYLGRG